MEIYLYFINILNNKRKIQKRDSYHNFINICNNKINKNKKTEIKSKAKIIITNKKNLSSIKCYNLPKCKLNYSYNNYLLLIITIYFIIFPLYKSKNISLQKLNLISQISLRIDDTGDQYILSTEYQGIMPDTILINGEEKQIISKKYNLVNPINNITMKWKESINDTSKMFYQLVNIKEIDLTDFDNSLVTNMESQFWSCFSLTSIKFKNFNTSLVENMKALFYNNKKLISLDLSNFGISKVTNMDFTFHGLELLTSLNLSKFDTSKVISMHGIFASCTSLISLNLSNFNTSSVE